jgi:hypothetical protein
VANVLESEAESVECVLERPGIIHEERGVFDVVVVE